MLKDYSSAFVDCAVYLPALNPSYAEFAATGSFKRLETLEPGDLNFLSPASRLFYYPYALYSAGQAAKTENAARKDNIVLRRDRNATRIIGDSGGFQVATDTIEWEGPETATRLLKWMEGHADYCMALDFPTGGISRGIIAKHSKRLISEGVNLPNIARLNGLGIDYNACLVQTLRNNRLFRRIANPGTKLLNVLQGRNLYEAEEWLRHARKSKFKGWAFAGYLTNDIALLLRMLIRMRDGGDLKGKEWLHFLGVGNLELGCVYTALQRAFENQIGPSIQISYDASSPFRMYGNQMLYSGFTLHPSGWSLQTIKFSELADVRNKTGTMMDAILSAKFKQADFGADAANDYIEDVVKPIAELDNVDLMDVIANSDQSGPNFAVRRHSSEMPRHYGTHYFPAESTVAHMLYLDGQNYSFFNNGNRDVDTDMLAANHNIHVLIDAHRRAQRAFDELRTEQVPARLIATAEVIKQVFNSETPETLIEQCERFLNFG